MTVGREAVKCNWCGAEDADVQITQAADGIHRVAFCRNCRKIISATTEPQNTVNAVHCPFCNSTDCKKISGASKVGKVLMWGVLAAGSVSKTWHCNSCGSNFG